MNTASTALRLAAAASAVSLAVGLAGCATPVPDAETRPQLVSAHVVAAIHRVLVHGPADRYVREVVIRARLADEAFVPPRLVIITRLHGR